MSHTPYFGRDPEKGEIRQLQSHAGYFYMLAFNECLRNNAEEEMWKHLAVWGIEFSFSVERFWVCLSGVKKSIYNGVYGWDAGQYLELYDRWRLEVEAAVEQSGYLANLFMVFEEEAKQLVVLFSPGEGPQCTPEELAARVNSLGQKFYERELFYGDTRYCNVTALSGELHGYAGIREGYLQTRKLNDLSFFHMEPAVLTSDWVDSHRNRADYRVVIGECHRLRQALDEGDVPACRKGLESLLLKTVKGAYRWTLLHDALSYCKHMLELRCTARGLEGVDLERLCDPKSYLRIEECVEALWPVVERLCILIGEQGPYQDLMLRAIYYIKLHYAEDIALTDVAHYANVNPNYLSGSFQKEMGLSVREFITRERVNAAKKLLEEENLRIADIAEAVGVHDVKYFSRLFKKAVGLTPGEYREKSKR